jgi:hypothetical protein
MRQRCYNPNNKSFPYYGGREDVPTGVCDRWCFRENGQHPFVSFLVDNGLPPEGKSLDRINNDGDYEPRNCRWATASVQARNQRPRKRKARRAKLADIQAHAASLTRAGKKAAS